MQLQRLAYQGLGSGSWEGYNDCVPRTRQLESLRDLPLSYPLPEDAGVHTTEGNISTGQHGSTLEAPDDVVVTTNEGEGMASTIDEPHRETFDSLLPHSEQGPDLKVQEKNEAESAGRILQRATWPLRSSQLGSAEPQTQSIDQPELDSLDSPLKTHVSV